MADAAVDFLLNNLKDLLIDHFQLITNTKTHIVSLEGDLRKFKGFLKDSLKQRRKDEETKALVRSIRDVVYDVEDVVDAFITEAKEKSKSKGKFYNFWKTPMELHNIGQMVAEVKAKVDKATTDLVNRKLLDDDEPRSDKAKYQVRPPTEKNVVGFEDVTEEIIGRLTEETDDLEIVSLTGMFGLGKTTLAWKIFKDPRILYKFPYHKWLTISQEFSDREIFLSILKDFTAEDINSKMDHELAHLVREYLENESFLIVMDDVWTPSDWGRLEVALPKRNGKGKVLVTSRHVEVGRCASRPRAPKELRFFKLEESWKLLRLEALGKLDCPDELEGVGKRIAENCKGLPLAVVVIGGILATKFSSDTSAMVKEWEKVATRVNAYLMDENQSDVADRMKNFISLSYDRLPYHLRSCFLYFGMFPEDYEIPVSKLIRMWIAEGFIQPSDSCSLEETAEMYLADLINRNLVQIKKFKPDGKIKTCIIHDALRDFCRAEAGNVDENFLREIKFNEGVFQPPVDKLDKYRRLSIHSNCSKFISLQPFGPRVRSFVCFPKEEEGFTLAVGNIPYILAAFKLLRVLDIKPITLPRVTSDIYQLVHLRYIVFSFKSSTLPPKFSDLWNIQTLIVDTTTSKLEVKADIWNMKYLRHFKTNVSATLPKPNKDSKHGAELQTLGTISVESCTTAILAQAANLKKLGIRGRLASLLEGKAGSFDSLGGMRNLEKLKLINDLDGRPASEGKLRGLPQAYQFPSNLKRLTLVATFLSWNSMSVLGLLERLVVLKLKKNAFSGDTWSLKEADTGFPCLEFLHIEETDLQVWKASPHHFPELKGLVLKNCGKLLGIPIGLGNVASFQMLDLHVCGSAAQSAKDILEAKIQKPAKGSAFKLLIFPPIE